LLSKYYYRRACFLNIKKRKIVNIEFNLTILKDCIQEQTLNKNIIELKKQHLQKLNKT